MPENNITELMNEVVGLINQTKKTATPSKSTPEITTAQIAGIVQSQIIKQRIAEQNLAGMSQIKIEENSNVPAGTVYVSKGATLQPHFLNAAGSKFTQAGKAFEEEIALHFNVPCLPPDGLIAFWHSFREIFQIATLQGDMSFFGKEPPPMVKIPTGINTEDYEMIPYCKIAPDAWEGGHIRPHINKEGTALVISGKLKRKFEPSVQEVFNRITRRLKEKSIYTGKSVMVDLTYLEAATNDPWSSYNPDTHAPKFIDMSMYTLDNIKLNEAIAYQFSANIFSRLQQPEANKLNGRAFKHGVLLAGDYGTGKTLAGCVLANMCCQNGVAFFHLKNVSHLSAMIDQVVAFGHPAMIWCEDIDQLLGTQVRTHEVNMLLNTLDGVNSKSANFMLVATTNHVERIASAFMRPGRIDSLIIMQKPDAKTANELLRIYARNTDGEELLSPDFDFAKSGQILNGSTPAFIEAVVGVCKGAAIVRESCANIAGKITNDDIALAKAQLDNHERLAKYKPQPTVAKQLQEGLRLVGDALQGDIDILSTENSATEES